MMSEAERRQLVDDLRQLRPAYNLPPVVVCERAADEIERLEKIIEDYKLVFGDIHKVELPAV